MQPLLTIIIPMYGVEKFIAKCLDSITEQSYRNLEIICVNDGTKDRSAEIAREYASRDDRIIVLDNPQNLGLFRARVEGMKIANGEYFAFVDADDFVSLDWFRLLMKRITEEDADMVIGNEVSVDENDRKYYYNNYRSFTKERQTIVGDDVLEAFYAQGGGCYAWHVVWNKIYSAKLIERCMPFFEMIDFHLIMCEDIAFSSTFYTHAKKLCFADADCYFYYRHSGASTGASTSKEKLIKNITDVGNVFKYVEKALKTHSEEKYELYKKDILTLKERYQRIWRNAICAANLNNNISVLDAMEEAFGKRKGSESLPGDFYFYDLTTNYSPRYNWIKNLIFAEDSIKVISFDIFDTLIVRPLYFPTDIFCFVGKLTAKKWSHVNEETFPKMRQEAEDEARRNSDKQDITITEIYDTFADMFGFSKEDAKLIKGYEEKLECKYCTARHSAKELYDLAIISGKQVIITSDMYLERATIEEILHKNGYTNYTALFLSSEKGKLKATGDLYACAVKELKVKPEEILHIGDNWEIDIHSATMCGLNAQFYPKATEVFKNIYTDIYKGNSAAPFQQKFFSPIDSTAFMSQLPARCALAVMANNSFDNPFTIFQQDSIFNGDAYYMGYYALGMHLMGMAEWILRIALENNYKKIVFLARDGKLIKDAFDYLCKTRNIAIKTDYFYATRKSLLPYGIKSKEDFYTIDKYMGLYYLPPSRIIEMFSDILNPLDEQAKDLYKKRGIDVEEKLKDYSNFYKFIDALLDISYSQEKHKAAFEKASSAFKKIFTENTASFDMGYSGRLQSIISDLAGSGVDTFFVFDNGYNTKLNTQNRFKVHSYYDYSPSVASIVREYFLSDPTPSCYGYSIKNDNITVLLENPTSVHTNDATYAVKEMQRAALNYCKDFWNVFGDMDATFTARNSDYALAFDYFIMNATEFDRYTFNNAQVEDEVFSGYTSQNISGIWSYHLSTMTRSTVVRTEPVFQPMENMLDISNGGKLKKAVAYFMFDKRLFREKLKNKFRRKK